VDKEMPAFAGFVSFVISMDDAYDPNLSPYDCFLATPKGTIRDRKLEAKLPSDEKH
jgi:hypothetical protein